MMPVYTPNKHSNEIFKLGDETFLNKVHQVGFRIDAERLEMVFNKKLDVNHIKIEELHKNYHTLITELKEAIEKKSDLVFEISKKISIYSELIKLEKILKFTKSNNDEFFVPSIFDFRGRMYQKSDTSLTFVPEIRYCVYTLNKKEFRNFDNEFKSKIKNTLSKYFYFIEKLDNSQILNLTVEEKEQIL